MSGITQYLSICDWFISLILRSSRFIHVVHMLELSFFLRQNIIQIVNDYCCFVSLGFEVISCVALGN